LTLSFWTNRFYLCIRLLVQCTGLRVTCQ
jgi:hypothetical protein